jgi:hypothetical protein
MTGKQFYKIFARDFSLTQLSTRGFPSQWFGSSPNFFKWWTNEFSAAEGSIIHWAAEEVGMTQDHTKSELCADYDAVMRFAQYGLFQQLAQIDPVLFILLQCVRHGGEDDKLDPRVISVPQAFISAQSEAEDESFFSHYHMVSRAPIYALVGIKSNDSPLHYRAIPLGTDTAIFKKFYRRYHTTNGSYLRNFNYSSGTK